MICIILFVCFCTSVSDKNKRKLDETFFNSSDTIVKDLPRDKNGEITGNYFLNHEKEKMAGVNSLEKGFDSIKMRFWYWYGYNDTLQLIEIENFDKKWSASLYTIKYGYTEHYDSMICYGKTEIPGKPKSGWENFIQKLFRANVLTLQSFESYYSQPTDASVIGVEIATKNKYKYYLYPEPLHYKEFSGANNMVEIMDLIEEEFNFRRIERF